MCDALPPLTEGSGSGASRINFAADQMRPSMPADVIRQRFRHKVHAALKDNSFSSCTVTAETFVVVL